MRTDIFTIIYIVGLITGSVIRAPYVRRSNRKTVATDRTPRSDIFRLTVVAVGMQVLPFIYLFSGWLDFAGYRLPTWVGIGGAPVFAVALWLLWRSHSDLGGNFSPKLQIREDHSLATGGVYRRIRHPMYTAHLLWAIAQILLLHNWIVGPGFLVTIIPMLLLRMPVEEEMMLERFGDEYRAYMERTGCLFPRFGK